MSHTTITFLVIAAVVVVFILDRFPVAVVAVATALTLWATGVLDLHQAVLGQLISNLATALIVIPVALETAKDLDVSARPVLMCVTVSAAAALITPIATPANLMVMEPGGYRFSDYWKLGLPLLVLFGAVAVLLVPVFWRF